MLDEGKPDLVLFYHDNLDESRGTIDMITRASEQKFAVDEGPSYEDSKLKMTWHHGYSEEELEVYYLSKTLSPPHLKRGGRFA